LRSSRVFLLLALAIAVPLLAGEAVRRILVGQQPDGSVVTPVNQVLRAYGEEIAFPGRSTDLALSDDGKTLVALDRVGYVFIDTETKRVKQRLTASGLTNSYAGILFTPDQKQVVAARSKGGVQFLDLAEESAKLGKAVPLPTTTVEANRGAVPSGMALMPDGKSLLVCLSRLNTLGVIDLEKQELVAQIPVGNVPFGVVVTDGGKKAYVTNWAGRAVKDGDRKGPSSGTDVVTDERGIAASGTVSVVDLVARKEVKQIEVGLHPSAIAYNAKGASAQLLFVANSNSDTVSVINIDDDKVVATFSVKPDAKLPFGSAPTGLALSPDGRTLYVALGGNNCVSVIDVQSAIRNRQSAMRSLIPTGWYPTAIQVSKDGKTLYVANTKGRGSLDRTRRAEGKGHNSHDHLGSVSVIPIPDDAKLKELTKQVYANNRWDEVLTARPPVSPAPAIKNVIYIIKENRTYDQVFGDLPQGNGDKSLCQFGRDVTPNHHALAEQFVLLDNFYCCGILSADGHQWCVESYVTDYIERAFGGFPRSYPYHGTDAMAYASSGFIWDNALKAGKTFRNYGEFTITEDRTRGRWIDFYNDWKSGEMKMAVNTQTLVEPLQKYCAPKYPGFANMIPDQWRAEQFLREFREFERKGELPNLITMILPDDHTAGTAPGFPTPRAQVADNDFALGKIVEAVSKSKFWRETAILVVEDDPQGGLDHVDGHRTIALCISPYTKRGYVDSTLYNQTSMVRTIELLLGLPPMNQFDLTATPMSNCFTRRGDFRPYAVVPNLIPLDEMNKPIASLRGLARELALASLRDAHLDEPDEADQTVLRRAIWFSTHGVDLPERLRRFHADD